MHLLIYYVGNFFFLICQIFILSQLLQHEFFCRYIYNWKFMEVCIKICIFFIYAIKIQCYKNNSEPFPYEKKRMWVNFWNTCFMAGFVSLPDKFYFRACVSGSINLLWSDKCLLFDLCLCLLSVFIVIFISGILF